MTDITHIENPFKGASPYQSGDKFYGRETEIKELVCLIRNEPLTLLFSRSGTGKSSLINAGLFPELKKESEFFPVYIHINDDAIKETLATDPTDFVVKRCIEEIKKEFSNKKNFRVSLPQHPKPGSLFDFLYNTQIVEIDAASSSEYVIKPVLIFDQFEEIFTKPPEKSQQQFLLKEIKCLVENEVPEYLKETLINSDNESNIKLKNALKSKQKNFRILFSFREEYLPQFESLRKELPSIRFTNSRFRLEPFNIETSARVVKETAPRLPDTIPLLVSENIATQMEGFDDKRVDPFLLSLICQIIYFDLLSAKNLSPEETRTKVNRLVENAIEDYIDKVYSQIDEPTKEFIETKLITTDGKKNSVNYNSVEQDQKLNANILKLTNNPEYRLLNIGQFLDSRHITILHDRLLPPLCRRKDERLGREADIAMIAKQKELEASYNKRRKKLIASLILASALFAIILIVGLIYNSVISKEKQKAVDEKLSADSAKASLTVIRNNLIANRDSLRDVITKMDKLDSSNTKLTDRVKEKNIRLLATIATLNKTQAKLDIQLNENKEAIALNKAVIATNQAVIQEISKEIENKQKLAHFLVSQTNQLATTLRATDPFAALAISKFNYDQIDSMHLEDPTIHDEFKTALLNVYDSSTFFYKKEVPYNDLHFSTENELIAVSNDDAKTSYVNILDPTGPMLMQETLLRLNSDSAETDENSEKINRFGFSDDGDFFYIITTSQKKFIVYAWRIKNRSIDRGSPLRKEIELTDDTKFSYSLYAKGRKITFYKRLQATYRFITVDIEKEGPPLYHTLNLGPFETLSALSSSIDHNHETIITSTLSEKLSGDIYSIYELESNKKLFELPKIRRGSTTSLSFIKGDSMMYKTINGKDYVYQFITSRNKVPYDSIKFPPEFKALYSIIGNDKVFAFDFVGNMEIYEKNKNKTWESVYSGKSNVEGNPLRKLMLSKDKKLLTYVNDNSGGIFDLVSYKITDTFSIPTTFEFPPILNKSNNMVTAISDNRIYHIYFRKPKGIKTVQELYNLLNSGFLSPDWPLTNEEKEKYGIK